MKITLVIALVIAVFSEKSSQQCFTSYSQKQPNRDGYKDLYSGQQEFSLALLNAIHKVLPNENLFFSPYSTYHALLIAYFLTGGQTEGFLKKALRFKPDLTKEDLYAAYKTDKLLTQLIARSAQYEFTNANKIYVADDVSVKECVLNGFPDELETKGFNTNPEAARVSINNWVSNTTHSMIQNLIPPGTIDRTTDLVLVNAAYFKGMWENKFNPNLTQKEVFYVSPSKQIMVDMMHTTGTFRHDVSEALGAHILELPFKGDNISMYILLPPFANMENSIQATLKNLNLENFKKIVEGDQLVARTVDVALPKFSLETTIEMTAILESLGVGNLFQGDANFSALTSEKISVGAGIHKAKIELDENGAYAAAATALISWRMGDEEDLYIFTCNRPFIYLIYNGETHTVLFTGIFKSPF